MGKMEKSPTHLRVKSKKGKNGVLGFTVQCREYGEPFCRGKLELTDFGNDLWEVGDVLGTRQQWLEMFKEIGLLYGRDRVKYQKLS